MQVAPSVGPYISDVQAAAPSRPATKPFTNLVVSVRTLRTCWLIISGYHLFNASFLLAMGWDHLFTARDDVYENVWLIQIPQSTLRIGGYTYCVLAAVHLLAVIKDVVHSIRLGRLSFGNDTISIAEMHPSSVIHHDRTSGVWQVVRLIISVPVNLWEKYFGVRGIFGVQGVFFFIGFYLRQVVEIILQTYQAYMISRSLPSLWINRFVVAMIVVNCLYAPIVNTVLARHPAVRRLVCLALDISIDFSIAVAVPIVTMIPGLQQLDWKTHSYPLELVYNDVWITNGIMTSRQTMVSGPVDYVSSMLPHITGLAGLETIKSIIQRVPAGRKRRTTPGNSALKSFKSKSTDLNSVSPSGTHVAPTARPTGDDRERHRKATWMFNVFTVGWAVGVVALHFASHKSSAALNSCELNVNAWLAENVSCAVANINCYRRGLAGSSGEMASILREFQRPSLARLVFSHCPELHIPPEVNQFSSMIAIETFNSTLVEWPASSAISNTLTPNVLTINFVDTNFTGSIPPGVFHKSLPMRASLAIHGSNLTELPQNIGVEWFLRVFPELVIEYTNIKEIPESFEYVIPFRLSLGRNKIETLPEQVFEHGFMQRLRLSGNPLKTLPTSFGSTTWMTRVWLEHTKISVATPFLLNWWSRTKESGVPGVSFSLYGSPACDINVQVDYCQPAPDIWRDEFPYKTIAAQRPLYPIE